MSNTFRFKLEPLLDLRLRAEDREAQELANAQRQREEIRRSREELEQARMARTAQIGETSGAGESVGQLKNLRFVLDWLDVRIQTAHAAEDEATVRLSTHQDAYSHAVRDRMTLDRLKDRRKEAWDADQRRTQQNEMDEIAISRHEVGRRVNSEGN